MSEGVTSEGFVRKELTDILTDKEDALRSVFGEELNLAPESPDGQVAGLLAASDNDLWLLAEAVYNAFNPAAASGATLDNLVALNGISRLAASGSLVTLTCTGTNGTTIPIGSTVKASGSEIEWETLAEVAISGGTVDVLAQATTTGPSVGLAGTLTTIATPVAGWDAVTNASDATPGRDEETDAELRIRRRRSVAFPSQSMIDSIYSAVADLDGVRSVSVLENDTDSVDGNGQPAHSIQVVVEGGADADIAEAIFQEKAAGIEAFGTSSETVQDSQGFDHDIGFTRPDTVEVYVIVNLTTFSDFPASGVDDIIAALIAYVDENFRTGDDVIYSRLFTPINETPGHQVDSLYIDTSYPPASTNNVTIDFDEIAEVTAYTIEVNT